MFFFLKLKALLHVASGFASNAKNGVYGNKSWGSRVMFAFQRTGRSKLFMTDSSTPNSQGMKAFSLCMFCFAPSIKLSRVVPLALNNRGTGSKLVTRSGVFEIPVAE